MKFIALLLVLGACTYKTQSDLEFDGMMSDIERSIEDIRINLCEIRGQQSLVRMPDGKPIGVLVECGLQFHFKPFPNFPR